MKVKSLSRIQPSATPWTCSPPGSSVHGIFQAGILLLLLLSHFSRVQLCATPQTAAHQASRPWDSPGKNTGVGCHFLLQCMKVKSESEVIPWTAAYQAPPSMGFSRQKYWSGVPLPSPRALNFENFLARCLILVTL